MIDLDLTLLSPHPTVPGAWLLMFFCGCAAVYYSSGFKYGQIDCWPCEEAGHV